MLKFIAKLLNKFQTSKYNYEYNYNYDTTVILFRYSLRIWAGDVRALLLQHFVDSYLVL